MGFCLLIFLRFFGLDASPNILEPGHILDEGIRSGDNDVEEADTGEIAFDGLLFKLLLTKEAGILT